MRKKSVIVGLLLCVMAFCGCGRNKEPESSDVTRYLKERYHNDFECSMDITNTDEKGEKSRFYQCKDEDGVEFWVQQAYSFELIEGQYTLYDDYLMQWLLANSDYCRNLLNSEYECEVVDTIREDDVRLGFALKVDNFEEFQDAIFLAYYTVEAAKDVLPDYGYEEDELDVRRIYPEIYFVDAKGDEIKCGISIRFGSEVYKYSEELETVLGKYSYEYVDLVRAGNIDENLSYEVLGQYGPEKFSTILYEGEDIGLFLQRDDGGSDNITRDGSEVYYIYDQGSLNEEPLEFETIASWAKCAGYYQKDSGNADEYVLTSGDDEVAFVRDRGTYYVMKNGEKVTLQGSFKAVNGKAQAVLTVKDLEELFGMSIIMDYAEDKVEIFETVEN